MILIGSIAVVYVAAVSRWSDLKSFGVSNGQKGRPQVCRIIFSGLS